MFVFFQHSIPVNCSISVLPWNSGKMKLIDDFNSSQFMTCLLFDLDELMILQKSFCLEDAWHLAHCLNNHSHDLRQAFTNFTDIRFEKTANIIAAARNFASSLFNQDKAFCMTRNENSRNTDYAKMAAAMSRGWAQHLPLCA